MLLPPKIYKFALFCFWFVLSIPQAQGETKTFTLTVNIPETISASDYNSKKGLDAEYERAKALGTVKEVIERRKGKRIKLITVTLP